VANFGSFINTVDKWVFISFRREVFVTSTKIMVTFDSVSLNCVCEGKLE
jgi:hypothetical protein